MPAMQDDIDVSRQEQAREDRKKQSDQATSQTIEDVRWQMSERVGRRLMYGLLERAGVYRGSFTGDATTFFREGERNVGLFYLNLLNAHFPDEFVLMLKERREDVS